MTTLLERPPARQRAALPKPDTDAPRHEGSAGGEWDARHVVALMFPFMTLGHIVYSTVTGQALGGTLVFAAVMIPGTVLMLSWDAIAKALHQATRDLRRVAGFMAWWFRAPNGFRPPLAHIRAVYIAGHILGAVLMPNIALVPVHPAQAPHVLNTSRPVLIRRNRIRPGTQYVLLYVTAPVMRVVAIARVGKIETARPGWLAFMFGSRLDLDVPDFTEYTAGRKQATAIPLEAVYPLAQPVALADACGIARASGSVRYLRDPEREHLRAFLNLDIRPTNHQPGKAPR